MIKTAPFVSQAQRAFMWINHPELAREFEDATPAGKKLPRHVRKRRADKPQAEKSAADLLTDLLDPTPASPACVNLRRLLGG